MANPRILYQTFTWDNATVTKSSEKSGRPATNVLRDHPGQKWVSSTDVGEWVVFNLGSAQTIDCIGIFAHNLTPLATVNLAANSSDFWTSPPVSINLSVALDADNLALPRIVNFPSVAAYQYWRLFINDATNPDGNIQIGRVMAGQYYEFARGPQRGLRWTWKDPSNITHLPGTLENPEDFGAHTRFRQIRPEWPLRSDAERRKLEAFFRWCGNVRPFLFCTDPANASEDSAYCWNVADMDYLQPFVDRADFLQMVFEEKTY